LGPLCSSRNGVTAAQQHPTICHQEKLDRFDHDGDGGHHRKYKVIINQFLWLTNRIIRGREKLQYKLKLKKTNLRETRIKGRLIEAPGTDDSRRGVSHRYKPIKAT
jgi:hypothetical protein